MSEPRAIPIVRLLTPVERAQIERRQNREMWDRVFARDAAERRRLANMLCRRGHDWRDQGPMFMCGAEPSVTFWRECSRCHMTLHERPGKAPHRKRLVTRATH